MSIPGQDKVVNDLADLLVKVEAKGSSPGSFDPSWQHEIIPEHLHFYCLCSQPITLLLYLIFHNQPFSIDPNFSDDLVSLQSLEPATNKVFLDLHNMVANKSYGYI